jgi:hypothetical protein
MNANSSTDAENPVLAVKPVTMRLKSEAKPKSFVARLWRWHTRWCPGWKAYQGAPGARNAKLNLADRRIDLQGYTAI